VWFIIGFPILILLAFLYLVTWHHRKLYSPSDFRTDESFLTSGDPVKIGEKYIAEGQPTVDNSDLAQADEESSAERDAADGMSGATGEVQGEGDRISFLQSAPFPAQRKNTVTLTEFAAYAYMIEGLVMQELQNEYKSPIRRDAAFPMANGRMARVDGMIEAPSGPLIAEIKLIRRSSELDRRIGDGIKQLRSFTATAREIMNPKASGILILVLDGQFNDEEIDRIKKVAKTFSEDEILVRVLESKILMNKYGLLSSS